MVACPKPLIGAVGVVHGVFVAFDHTRLPWTKKQGEPQATPRGRHALCPAPHRQEGVPERVDAAGAEPEALRGRVEEECGMRAGLAVLVQREQEALVELKGARELEEHLRRDEGKRRVDEGG